MGSSFSCGPIAGAPTSPAGIAAAAATPLPLLLLLSGLGQPLSSPGSAKRISREPPPAVAVAAGCSSCGRGPSRWFWQGIASMHRGAPPPRPWPPRAARPRLRRRLGGKGAGGARRAALALLAAGAATPGGVATAGGAGRGGAFLAAPAGAVTSGPRGSPALRASLQAAGARRPPATGRFGARSAGGCVAQELRRRGSGSGGWVGSRGPFERRDTVTAVGAGREGKRRRAGSAEQVTVAPPSVQNRDSQIYGYA